MIAPERVFKRLVRLVPDLADLEAGTARVSKSGAFMDLHLDVLSRCDTEAGVVLEVALAHYYEQNGDLVPDPDMTMRVRLADGTAEALSFQDLRSYKEVYPEEGKVVITQMVHQNEFLGFWLLNAWKQGHRLGPQATRRDGS